MAKGKGWLQTYWLDHFMTCEDEVLTDSPTAWTSHKFNGDEDGGKKAAAINKKTSRLVDWNVDVLNRLLGQIVSH